MQRDIEKDQLLFQMFIIPFRCYFDSAVYSNPHKLACINFESTNLRFLV